MLFYLASRAVSQSAGYLYPAYASYKALKTRNAKALVHWLQYWAVLGMFTLVEFFADIFLFWVPFYYQLKMLFILWLVLPQTNGCNVIYRSLLHPTLERHEKDIDEALQQAQSSALSTSTAWGRQAVQAIHKAAVDSLTSVPSGQLSDGSVSRPIMQTVFASTPPARIEELPSPLVEKRAGKGQHGGENEDPLKHHQRKKILPNLLSSAAASSIVNAARQHLAPITDALDKRAHGGHQGHAGGSSGAGTREEQYISSQRKALQRMMDQLDRAEAELLKSRRKDGSESSHFIPHPPLTPPPPPVSGVSSTSSGVDPTVSGANVPRPHHRRVQRDEENGHKRPGGRLRQRNSAPEFAESDPARGSSLSSASTAMPPGSAPAGPFSMELLSNDGEGAVYADEDMSFSDREMEELLKAAKLQGPDGVQGNGHGQPPADASGKWMPTLW